MLVFGCGEAPSYCLFINLCVHFIGKSRFCNSSSPSRRTSTMATRVGPRKINEKERLNEKMKSQSKPVHYLMYGIHTMVYFLGLNPYKIENKGTVKVSFHWFSRTTFWSLIRLVLFNSPFSILPFVLFAVCGQTEWDQESLEKYKKSSTALSPVFLIVGLLEWVSCLFFLFILSKVANKIHFISFKKMLM